MASVASPINWTPETEVCFFYAMKGNKPVGINKHFHMMCIHEKFCQSLGQPVSSQQLWEHLQTMYNLKALDESEASPFRNSTQDFKLPPEIVNFRKDQAKVTSEDSALDDESQPKTTNSKGNRKRTRNAVLTSPSSPAQPSVKRRRQ